MSQTIEGHILTPQGFVRGRLLHTQGCIEAIEGTPIPTERVLREADAIVLPGFVDCHVHGGDGHDIMQGGDAAAQVARCHARHGTTSLLATTMTAPFDEIEAALRALSPHCVRRPVGGARVLGVHLEGPYISPGKLGAQPDFAISLDLEQLQALSRLAPIRVLTLAPEVNDHQLRIAELNRAGFIVQIGHSAGSYDDGVAALEQGARGFTHLFNAMTGLHHREPGMVGAALAHAQHAELIPDLLHLHPGAIRAALRAIPCAYCVTDSTSAAGMPDGEYQLGRYRVFKCLGGVRLADNTLAGSALTMDQALRNLVAIGLSLDDAARRVSTYAADYLGMTQIGRLQPGAEADVVVFDRDLRLRRVLVEGEEIDIHAACPEAARA
nr:N-acetylglucosamine-6-phosphate deacetylase [uncultured Roseateles sp.]